MSAELHIVASLLRRGQTLDNFSTGLTLLGFLLGLAQLWIISPSLLSSAVAVWLILTGLIEKYYALRVAFDADLFQALATDPQRLVENTQALDQALVALHLLPVDKCARPWALRGQGALKLLRQQLLFLALQVIVPLGVMLIHPWFSLH